MNFFKSLAQIREYRRDPIAFFEKQFRLNGHRSELDFFGRKLIILSHPDDVVHVLKESNQHYSKGRTAQAMRQFLGEGLLTNDGESWKRQQRLLRPMMTLKSVYDFGPKIDFTTVEMLKTVKTSVSIDSFEFMNKMTWRIVLNTLFSQKATPELDSWLDDVIFLMGLITDRTRSALKLPLWLPTPRHVKTKRIYKKFEKFIFEMIESRLKDQNQNRDLLQLLINIEDEENAGTRMGRSLIRDEILTFLMAGHETVTNTMSWTLILLAQNPDYLSRLRIEADQFIKTKDYQELNSAPWMSAVIDESMRLYPPVWAFMRMAETQDEMKNLTILPKTNVVLSPYLSHRAADLWEKPLEFFPERFLDKKKIVQGKFYPYGLGPRACIGSNFAGMESKIILANIIHQFDWFIENPQKQTHEASITLRPTNNTQMRFERRK